MLALQRGVLNHVTLGCKRPIDLVLTSMPHNITKTIAFESGFSDHCMIGTVRKLNSLRFKPRVISCRNYENYNSAKFNSDLKDAPWGQVYNAPDLDTAYDNFQSIVVESVDKHSPMIRKKVRGLHCPWLTTEITDLIKTRDYHLKRAKEAAVTMIGLCTGNTEIRLMLVSEKVKPPIIGQC